MTTVNVTTDRFGQPLTTSHRSSADHYDAAVESLLRFRDDVVAAWEATVAGDPGFAMGHIGRVPAMPDL
jgi:hypothetical protein